jgi:actin related protein 2/3 complex subunit 2
MLILDQANRILAETVSSRIIPTVADASSEDAPVAKGPLEVRLCDFDDVSYHIKSEPETPSLLEISMSLPCFASIKNFGGQAAVEKHFGAYAVAPRNGNDVTLVINVDTVTEDRAALVQRLSLLKALVLGGVFAYFSAPVGGVGAGGTANFRFKLRSDTEVFVVPAADRVVFIFSLSFSERTDNAIARIFLQEFQEARRRPGMGSAPTCTFREEPPAELAAFNVTEKPAGAIGFLSFCVLPAHVNSAEKVDKVAVTLQSFRTYIQYHIKCSKSHFHAAMRAKARDLLKVLNRAKVVDEDAEKKMKTFGGKTFQRS